MGRLAPTPNAVDTAPVTYLLIHGGGATGRFWDRLLPHLDRPALAVDLPGRNGKPGDLATLSVEDEVASVVADVQAAGRTGPIVVVAHSSGGLVVPGVVAGLNGTEGGVPRVRHVVLNAALVPPDGGCGLDCMKPHHREGLEAALAATERDGGVITLPGPPADPEPFRLSYGGDPLDDETLAYVVDPVRCVEDTVHHYLQPVSWAAVTGIPVTYILNERDRPIPPATQHTMAERLPPPSRVVEVASGHLFPVTAPIACAALLAGIAAST